MTDKSNWYQFSEAALTFFVACLDRWNLWKQLDLHCDWQLQLLRLQRYRTEWWLGSKEISQNQSSQQITQTPSVTISWIFFPLFPQLFFFFFILQAVFVFTSSVFKVASPVKALFPQGYFQILKSMHKWHKSWHRWHCCCGDIAREPQQTDHLKHGVNKVL